MLCLSAITEDYLTIYHPVFYRWREIGDITNFDLLFNLSDGGHRITSSVHSDLRLISTAVVPGLAFSWLGFVVFERFGRCNLSGVSF